MKIFFRLLLLVAVLALGFFAWTWWFPDPKVAIRNRLHKLAQLASFSGNEGNIRRMADVERLGGFFSEDAQVMVDVPGMRNHTFEGRDELMQAALAAKAMTRGVKAEFIGLNIELNSGSQSALVDLTLKAKVGGDSDLIVQELKFNMKMVNGTWLITRVETVKTLKS